MALFLILLGGFLAAISASVIPSTIEDVGNTRIEIFDDAGNPHIVDIETPLDEQVVHNITKNAALNQYWLYTRSNPNNPQILTLNNAASVHNSNFGIGRITHVIAHGWINSGHHEPNPSFRTALLAKSDVNIIVLDWNQVANSDYTVAVAGVPSVGQGLGQFIIFLNSLGVPWTNMHLIGFSLGAHVVGNAGRTAGGRVARITGLDPAGPLWLTNSNRLSSTDAMYVEGIHTDGLAQGIGQAVGNADFFPNGGYNMPGCANSGCNHNRAWEYYGATITFNHLWGNLCANLNAVTTNSCTGNTFPMGNDDLRKWGSGLYRVNTNSGYPY